jgi:hypothetical protein
VPPQAYAPPAYAPAPPAPVGYATAAAPVGGLGDLFSFQRMATPAILPLVFWLGAGYCLFNGLRLVLGFVLITSYHTSGGFGRPPVTGFSTRISVDGLVDRVFSLTGMYSIIDALFWIVLGPLFFRGFCDLILAASRLLASERK